MRNFLWALLCTFGCAAAPAVLYQDPEPAPPVVVIDAREQMLRSWEEYFRACFVPPAELVLERGTLPENVLGQTAIEGGPGAWALRVTIREDLEGHLMIAVLLHELAHVMSFHPEVGTWMGAPHGPEWGLWSSRIWTVLVEGGVAC